MPEPNRSPARWTSQRPAIRFQPHPFPKRQFPKRQFPKSQRLRNRWHARRSTIPRRTNRRPGRRIARILPMRLLHPLVQRRCTRPCRRPRSRSRRLVAKICQRKTYQRKIYRRKEHPPVLNRAKTGSNALTKSRPSMAERNFHHPMSRPGLSQQQPCRPRKPIRTAMQFQLLQLRLPAGCRRPNPLTRRLTLPSRHLRRHASQPGTGTAAGPAGLFLRVLQKPNGLTGLPFPLCARLRPGSGWPSTATANPSGFPLSSRGQRDFRPALSHTALSHRRLAPSPYMRSMTAGMTTSISTGRRTF